MKYTFLFAVAVIFAPFASSFADENRVAVMPQKHRNFFKNYCLDCHDAATQEGKVDLEKLSFDLNTLETAELWQKVLGALNSGDMPPKDERQPTSAHKTEFLSDLSQQLVLARKILSDAGGVITMRRLNRREYVNTIRDLLGVEVSAADLPDDANSGGFDTSGASLFFSSDQFEQYLKIAHTALDESILYQKRSEPKRERREAEVAANRTVGFRHKALKRSFDRAEAWKKSDKPPTAFGFIDAARVKFELGQYNLQFPLYDRYQKRNLSKTGALMITPFVGAYVDITQIPWKSPGGEYILRLRVGTMPNMPSHRKFIEFGRHDASGQKGEIIVQGCRQVTGTIEKPQILEIPISIPHKGGRFIGVRERQPNSRDFARQEFRAVYAKNKIGPDPALWIDWVEWEGPFVKSWPSAARKKVFFNRSSEKTDEYARQIIARFALRAFRYKQPTPTFIDKLLKLYKARRAMNDTFETAIKHSLAVVLASPHFLYITEPEQIASALQSTSHSINKSKSVQANRELSGLELAVRLSYFLWSAPPDAELYKQAQNGRLKDPKVLRYQTKRMLADPKAMEFVSGFAHQWLHMERLDFFQFSFRKFPEFDESVKEAARNEVYHTLETLLREDLPLGELLKSDFVVINDLLADYYGIKGVTGHAFRKVKVPSDSPRGGLLGTAAVLAMGSDGERSSPVERGAWVMRKLLNDPPPPAPANVPQLSRLSGKLLSARKLQTAHMEEPQCAQCHRKIDPIGFGLQNFDAAGQWREQELTEIVGRRPKFNKKKLHPIDASGTLPDGAPFKNYFELRSQIAKRYGEFARGFTEGLIEYGLGRPYGFSDYELAEEILKSSASQNYRINNLIHALIQSQKFRTK
jgi:hypothetical protein